MKKAPISKNDKSRLAALNDLKILDTDPEERFDRITRIAKKYFDVNTVLVSLVDEKRQWFKSMQGLDVCETPREISFCGHAIYEDDILHIPNTLEDERFADNPLVVEAPHIRFYAGCPIAAPNGEIVGTLCLIDPNTRDLSQDERGVLKDLGRCVEVELNRTHLLELEAKARNKADQAEGKSSAKSEFLSSMSHELRTPLNSILGFAQLLQIGQANPLNERQKDHVNQIVDAGQYLLELINGLLDLEKIESGKIHFNISDVCVTDIVAECAELLEPKAEESQLSMSMDLKDDDCMLRTDPVRLKQMVINILTNAIKYNRPQGSVHVALGQCVDSQIIRISVKDSGLGIPDDKKDQVFTPFDRLGAEKGDVDGHGIGLPLTQKIAHALGGDIGFESEYGQGSRFWIDLPIATPAN